MFATVQQMIGLTKLRETESADTRMGLLRRNLDKGKKQFSHQDSSERDVVYDYEQNVISVQSALLFLEGFLETRLDLLSRHEIADNVPASKSWIKSFASNQNATAASKAYRHAAEISGKDASKNAVRNQHKYQELQSIYQMIQDLRSLVDQGIEHLKIDTESSFLEAISHAVSKIKNTAQV